MFIVKDGNVEDNKEVSIYGCCFVIVIEKFINVEFLFLGYIRF